MTCVEAFDDDVEAQVAAEREPCQGQSSHGSSLQVLFDACRFPRRSILRTNFEGIALLLLLPTARAVEGGLEVAETGAPGAAGATESGAS